jgi:hypothetical protein
MKKAEKIEHDKNVTPRQRRNEKLKRKRALRNYSKNIENPHPIWSQYNGHCL